MRSIPVPQTITIRIAIIRIPMVMGPRSLWNWATKKLQFEIRSPPPTATIPTNYKEGVLRFLITGGAGFIGSHLAERLLERNDKVVLLDNLSTGSMENIRHLKG